LLWLHAQDGQPQIGRAPAALLLILLGAAQIQLAMSAREPRSRRPQTVGLMFWKWLFVGTVVCYLAGLALGSQRGGVYFFCAALACWYTTLLWLVVHGSSWLLAPAAAARRSVWHRLGSTVLASMTLAVGAEALLRLYALVADDRLDVAYVAKVHALPPGEHVRGRLVNRLGYWDKEFRPQPRAGVFRIAVLGDAVTLSGTAETNYLTRVERSLPGIEIYNFGLPDAGPREYAAQLMHEVAAYRPELVLTFVSIGDDVTHELPLPGAFDWRNLRLYQWSTRSAARSQQAQATLRVDHPVELSREEYLSSLSPKLAVCRTPIDEKMSGRWHDTLGYLDDIQRFCGERGIAAALVVVPSEFQLNPALCETLRRRSGLEPGQVDVELPQRRLADFAQERGMAMLDLLPSLRAEEDVVYERNDCQWNERGHELTANLLRRWIEQRYGTLIANNMQASLR
jgi:hypothetical protein